MDSNESQEVQKLLSTSMSNLNAVFGRLIADNATLRREVASLSKIKDNLMEERACLTEALEIMKLKRRQDKERVGLWREMIEKLEQKAQTPADNQVKIYRDPVSSEMDAPVFLESEHTEWQPQVITIPSSPPIGIPSNEGDGSHDTKGQLSQEGLLNIASMAVDRVEDDYLEQENAASLGSPRSRAQDLTITPKPSTVKKRKKRLDFGQEIDVTLTRESPFSDRSSVSRKGKAPKFPGYALTPVSAQRTNAPAPSSVEQPVKSRKIEQLLKKAAMDYPGKENIPPDQAETIDELASYRSSPPKSSPKASPTSSPSNPQSQERTQPRRKWNLQDFVINPDFNEGHFEAFYEVTRGGKRKCLEGKDCPECRDFYAILGDSAVFKESTVKSTSRHREKWSKPDTPPGFWRSDFPSTQEIAEEKKVAETRRQAEIKERLREALHQGRYMFRDERLRKLAMRKAQGDTVSEADFAKILGS